MVDQCKFHIQNPDLEPKSAEPSLVNSNKNHKVFFCYYKNIHFFHQTLNFIIYPGFIAHESSTEMTSEQNIFLSPLKKLVYKNNQPDTKKHGYMFTMMD